jgi:hypothetical protein
MLQEEIKAKKVRAEKLLVYQTRESEGSQPAMKIRRNEDVNKNYKIKM